MVAAWEQRCREVQEQGGAALARPVLMNSNLESVEVGGWQRELVELHVMVS